LRERIVSKVTICVPARNELYLEKCIDDIFEKATGDIEVILVLDNCWPDPIIKDRDNLTIIHWGGRRGMRTAINAGAEIGKGEFLMKVDAHCSFDEGFDEKLKASCDIDWVVTPTRYSLDSDTWTRRTDKPPVEHEYLSYPHENGEDVGLHAKYWWKERDRASKEDISENMAFQGSCWIMHMKYFKSLLYPMDEVNYGMFVAEPQEIGLKVWLSGGKQMLNKSTWYAHLWKGQGYRDLHTQKFGFPYTRVGRKELERGNKFSMDFWFNNRWVDRKHDLSYLVERFWPVPTWPEDRGLWGGK
jgi:glycosyltransferase involved in cell wall biosynthesis